MACIPPDYPSHFFLQFYRPDRPDRLWLRSLLARPPSLLGRSQPSASTGTAPAAAFAATQAVQLARAAAGVAAAGPGGGPAAGQGGALSEWQDGGQAEGPAECSGAGAPPVASIVEGRFRDAFRAFHPNRWESTDFIAARSVHSLMCTELGGSGWPTPRMYTLSATLKLLARACRVALHVSRRAEVRQVPYLLHTLH